MILFRILRLRAKNYPQGIKIQKKISKPVCTILLDRLVRESSFVRL